MLTTGLRLGEALALRWQDVDLDGGQLSVSHILQRVDGEFQLLEPKTASSRRTIRLAAVTMAALRAHRAEQAIVSIDGSGLVFPSATGAPIEAGNVRRCFSRLLRRAGFPKLRVHDLRHSWASIQLAMGTPAKVVQEQLGHSNIGTTMDQRRAAQRAQLVSQTLRFVFEKCGCVIHAVFASSPRTRSPRRSRRSRLAPFRRDITVPSGMSSVLAISS